MHSSHFCHSLHITETENSHKAQILHFHITRVIHIYVYMYIIYANILQLLLRTTLQSQLQQSAYFLGVVWHFSIPLGIILRGLVQLWCSTL